MHIYSDLGNAEDAMFEWEWDTKPLLENVSNVVIICGCAWYKVQIEVKIGKKD